MDDQALTQLKQTIRSLREERDVLRAEVYDEKQEVNKLQGQMDAVKLEADYYRNALKEKEDVRKEYERMIEESKNAYNRLTEGSFKLLKAVDNEGKALREKAKAMKAKGSTK